MRCYQLENRFTLVLHQQFQVVTYTLRKFAELKPTRFKTDEQVNLQEPIVDFEVLGQRGEVLTKFDPPLAIRVDYASSTTSLEARDENNPPKLAYYNRYDLWVVLGSRENYKFNSDRKGGGYATAVIYEWQDPEFAW